MAEFDNEVQRIKSVLTGLLEQVDQTKAALGAGLSTGISTLASSVQQLAGIKDAASGLRSINRAVNRSDITKLLDYAAALELIANNSNRIGGSAGGIARLPVVNSSSSAVNRLNAQSFGAAQSISIPTPPNVIRSQVASLTSTSPELANMRSFYNTQAANADKAEAARAIRAANEVARATKAEAKEQRDLNAARIRGALDARNFSEAEKLVSQQLAKTAPNTAEAVRLQNQLAAVHRQQAANSTGGRISNALAGAGAELLRGTGYSIAFEVIDQAKQMISDMSKVRNDLADIQRQLTSQNAPFGASEVLKGGFQASSYAGQPFFEGAETSRRLYRILGAVDKPEERLDLTNQFSKLALGSQTAFGLELEQSLEILPQLYAQVARGLQGIDDPALRAEAAIGGVETRLSKFIAVSRLTGAEGDELVQTYANLASAANGAGLTQDQLTALVASSLPTLGKSPEESSNVIRALLERPFSRGTTGGEVLLNSLGIETKLRDNQGNEVRRPIYDERTDENGRPLGVLNQVIQDTRPVEQGGKGAPIEQYARAIGGLEYAQPIKLIIEKIIDGTYKAAEEATREADPTEFDQTLQRMKDEIGPAFNELQTAFAELINSAVFESGGDKVIIEFIKALTASLNALTQITQNGALQNAFRLITGFVADIINIGARVVAGVGMLGSVADPRFYTDQKYREEKLGAFNRTLSQPAFERTTSAALSTAMYAAQADPSMRERRGLGIRQPDGTLRPVTSESLYTPSTTRGPSAAQQEFEVYFSENASINGQPTDQVSAAAQAQIILDRLDQPGRGSGSETNPKWTDMLRQGASNLSGRDYTNAIDSLKGIPQIIGQLDTAYGSLKMDVSGIAEELFRLGPDAQQQFTAATEPLFTAIQAQKELFTLEQALTAAKKGSTDADQEMVAKIEAQLKLKRELYKTQLEYLNAVSKEKNYLQGILADVQRYAQEKRSVGGSKAEFSAPGFVDTKGFTVEQIQEALRKAKEQQEALIRILPEYQREFQKAQFMFQSGNSFTPVTGINPGYVQNYLQQQKQNVTLPQTVDLTKFKPEVQDRILEQARNLQAQAVKLFPALGPQFEKERLFILRKNNELLSENGLSQEFLREAIDKNTDSQDELRGHFNIPGGYKVPTIWDYYKDGGTSVGSVNYPQSQEVSLELSQQLAQQALAAGSTENPDLGPLGNLVDPNAAPLGYPNPGTPGFEIGGATINIQNALLRIAAGLSIERGGSEVGVGAGKDLEPWLRLPELPTGGRLQPGAGMEPLGKNIDFSDFRAAYREFLADLKAFFRTININVNIETGKSVTTTNAATPTLQAGARTGSRPGRNSP